MREFNADLHIHSPYSIGVSRNMTLENIVEGARQKGIDIVGTGDVLQPDWSEHLHSRLVSDNDELSFRGINFVLTVEIEDSESIHHLVILRDFEAVSRLRNELRHYSTNVTDRWGGRPRVSIGGAELAFDVGANRFGGIRIGFGEQPTQLLGLDQLEILVGRGELEARHLSHPDGPVLAEAFSLLSDGRLMG